MFKGATFQLFGPICKCKKINLGWFLKRISKKRDPNTELHIFCKTCDEEIVISPESFRAEIKLDTLNPRSKRIKSQPEKNKFDSKKPVKKNKKKVKKIDPFFDRYEKDMQSFLKNEIDKG